ncbi:AMP-binding protein [Roseibium aestuarii]|uniref:AMP-binding protein n=1 Tax=Roseibium aestuarii TaxID=2600299 RepID=A0ABW4JWJ2_9HYPH|nr:AMP-binding protein [Roseibium aestuarii]
MLTETQTFFFSDLARHADRCALIAQDGRRISYRELDDLARGFGADLRRISGKDRGLLLLEMSNTPEAVTAYLGALQAGWPVVLAAEGTVAHDGALVSTFKPDLIWQAGTLTSGPGSSDPLHPDLGVMLSTSGSTGSTKLVRLSHTNLHENARSIAEYLGLGPERVAVTTLPMHYSYGLSVLNSFLKAGGTIALTNLSVIDGAFRPFLDQVGVTDLAGVPYTYELFERLGLRNAPPRTLKTLTQAGGRLSPDLVRTYAEFAKSHGLSFVVMYGQTEATARMAYLPPDLALAHSSCIGLPIPRGSFEIRDSEGNTVSEPGISGELVYRGPNVMMGYALARSDLAKSAELQELVTGDLAERTAEGLYRIVGRLSRFAKIAGLRIGFDDVEALLRKAGFDALVTGNDGALLLAMRSGDPDAARTLVARECGLPPVAIFAWTVTDVPHLSSGKVDLVTLRETGLTKMAAAEAASRATRGREMSVAELYARAMNRPLPDEKDSFAGLGGDSLAYVSVSIGLEELIGTIPEGWETLPVAQLQARADAHQPEVGTAGPVRRRLTMGTDVLLRLLAISLIFLGHSNPDHTEFLRGGSGILFALAGYSMAMIHLPKLLMGEVRAFLVGTATRLLIPYMLLMTALLVVTPAAKSISWYLLGSVFVLTPEERSVLFSFWFVESLIHAMVITCGLFLIPAFRYLMRERPFVVMLGLSILAGGLSILGRAAWPNGNEINLTVDGWLYPFFLGWAAFFARSWLEKLAVPLVALGFALAQFGAETGRPWWLAGALAILLLVATVRIEYRIGKLLVLLAGATYFMYLCHPLVVHVVRFKLGALLPTPAIMLAVYFGSIAAGLVASVVWSRLLSGVRSASDRIRHRQKVATHAS